MPNGLQIGASAVSSNTSCLLFRQQDPVIPGLGPDDASLGRGTRVNRNSGNVKLRKLAQAVFSHYENIPEGKRHLFANDVTDLFLSQGRIVNKDKAGNYFDAPKKECIKKVQTLLRDYSLKERRRRARSVACPVSPLAVDMKPQPSFEDIPPLPLSCGDSFTPILVPRPFTPIGLVAGHPNDPSMARPVSPLASSNTIQPSSNCNLPITPTLEPLKPFPSMDLTLEDPLVAHPVSPLVNTTAQSFFDDVPPFSFANEDSSTLWREIEEPSFDSIDVMLQDVDLDEQYDVLVDKLLL